MRKFGQLLAITAALLGVGFPVAAHAQLDPADSISIAAPAGTAYAGDPFQFTGAGTADGQDAENYQVQVLYTPSSSPILSVACPSDYSAAAEAIEQAFGGPGALTQYSQLASMAPALLEAGPYTWMAPINSIGAPTVTTAGSYVACAYLLDALDSDTFAVSSPVAFQVAPAPGTSTTAPPSATAPPTRFGGPGAKQPSPGLKVVAGRRLIRAPGHNFLHISGSVGQYIGSVALVVTLKATRSSDGCAPEASQDRKLTRADSGRVLATYESVTPDSAGNVASSLPLTFKQQYTAKSVVCAYLVDGDGNRLAAGDLRFSPHPPRAHHHSHSG